MATSAVQCFYKAVCTVNPFGDGVRSSKIVCSPTDTALNVTQLSLYYGSLDKVAGDLFAEWPASTEAAVRCAAQITRDGAAFEALMPKRINRVNFQYFATISGIDAAGASITSSTSLMFSRHTCNGLGLTNVAGFLLSSAVVAGAFLLFLCGGGVAIVLSGGSVVSHYRRVNNNNAVNGSNDDNIEM
jgi:hypothetical protein